MTLYTAEISWQVPCGGHVQIEAETPEAAVAELYRQMQTGELDVSKNDAWWDGASATEVTGLWVGDQSYNGPDTRSPADALAAERNLAKELCPLVLAQFTQALTAAESFISG